MTLTPSSLRLDLKCGKGAISEGEKCTKGPATRVQEAKPTLPGKSPIKKSYVALAAYGGLVAIGLYQAKNVRQAYAQKFDPAQRYTNYTGTIGNPADVIKQMQRSNKAGAPSLFGDVTFGKLNGKDIIVKRLGSKGPLGAMQVTAMETQGVISAKTGAALRKAQGALQTNEVQGAELAGKLGFGPRVVAAGNNSLITEVARGRPLSSQDRLARNGAKLQQELQQNPGAGIKKIAKLQWLGFTKGTEISAINKNRIIDNMARMHTAGISHNDLHPGNIFVSDKGAQFIDFGTSERGGGAVSAEFVRMMNPPRTGLQQNGGMGYNLRSVDPKGYAVADKRIRQAIGKSVGTLTAADIHKAVTKSSNKELLEQQLQKITDDYYMEHARRPRSDSLTPASLRLYLKCGKGAISPGEKCTKGAAQRVNPAQKTYKLSANERAIYTNAFSQGKSAHLKEGINRHKSTTDPVQAAINKLRKRELRNRRIKTVASVALTAGLIASVIDNSRRATPWATGFAP